MTTPTPDDFVDSPSDGWSMLPFRCEACREPCHLFARIRGRLLCSDCWRLAGSPWPRSEASQKEIHEAELRIRERMLKRGGEDAYRVKAGKS
jgi:hypothetical protein